jgi:hypothetical protein
MFKFVNKCVLKEVYPFFWKMKRRMSKMLRKDRKKKGKGREKKGRERKSASELQYTDIEREIERERER